MLKSVEPNMFDSNDHSELLIDNSHFIPSIDIKPFDLQRFQNMNFDVFNDEISIYNNENDINLNFTKLSDFVTFKINVSERKNGI